MPHGRYPVKHYITTVYDVPPQWSSRHEVFDSGTECSKLDTFGPTAGEDVGNDGLFVQTRFERSHETIGSQAQEERGDS